MRKPVNIPFLRRSYSKECTECCLFFIYFFQCTSQLEQSTPRTFCLALPTKLIGIELLGLVASFSCPNFDLSATKLPATGRRCVTTLIVVFLRPYFLDSIKSITCVFTSVYFDNKRNKGSAFYVLYKTFPTGAVAR